MRNVVGERLTVSLKQHLYLVAGTGVLGVVSKLYTLVIFLVSIRVVSKLFESGSSVSLLGSLEGHLGAESMLDLSTGLLALGLLLAFFLVGVLDYWFLKIRSILTVYAMAEFGLYLEDRPEGVKPSEKQRALNSFRLMVEAKIGYWVFAVVCLCSVMCLFFVNIYFGCFLLIGIGMMVFVAQLIPKKILRNLVNQISASYHSRLSSAVEGQYAPSVELVASKYEQLYLQQSAFILTHVLVGLTLAILVLSNSVGYLNGIGVFDIVVFIYTVRFVSNNGRNAMLSFLKFQSHSSTTNKFIV